MNIRLIPKDAIVVIDNHWYKKTGDITKRMPIYGRQTVSKFVNVHNKKDVKLFWRGIDVELRDGKYYQTNNGGNNA